MLERNISWERAQAIANRAEVEEALANFSEDSTEDNGIMVVTAIMEAVKNEPEAVLSEFEERLERATMRLLGKDSDPSPGVNWECNRYWKVNRVRNLMRAILQEFLNGK